MSSNLMEKLAISKAIMDKHSQMGRSNNTPQSFEMEKPELENFEAPSARYNIPQELMSENKTINPNPQPVTKDRILNSKLPDEIKRLMIENPIEAVNPMSPSNSVLSDELIEKASKLMGTKKPEKIMENKSTQIKTPSTSELKRMMKEVVEEVLAENGLIIESDTKTNETMTIRVGQHIFEGKISRIKKTK